MIDSPILARFGRLDTDSNVDRKDVTSAIERASQSCMAREAHASSTKELEATWLARHNEAAERLGALEKAPAADVVLAVLTFDPVPNVRLQV